MAKAVWRKNNSGKDSYVGHVPAGYRLKPNEYFRPLPNVEDIVDPELANLDRETRKILNTMNKYHRKRKSL